MGYRYHELRPLISYFPCHWIVPVDFPNTCPMKIVKYRIIARYGRDIYTLTQSFPNQQWCNKSTYDLVEGLLFPLSFYRPYIKFKERYSDVSKFLKIYLITHVLHGSWRNCEPKGACLFLACIICTYSCCFSGVNVLANWQVPLSERDYTIPLPI